MCLLCGVLHVFVFTCIFYFIDIHQLYNFVKNKFGAILGLHIKFFS